MPALIRSSSVLLLCALLAAPMSAIAAGTDYMELITRYTQRLNNIYDGTWAYTYTVNDKRKDEVRVRRVDPSEPDFRRRDQLLSVNGAPPTERRLAQHNRQLEKRERRRLRDGARLHEDPDRPYERPGQEKERFLAAIIPESIVVEKQEGDLLYLKFKGREEGREKVFDHLDGLLILDTKQEYIREMQLTPTGEFSPFFLTKVEDAFLSVKFDLIDGEPFQTSAVWKLLGQALIVKNLDADMEVEWFDFEKVQPASLELSAAESRDEDSDN